MKRPAAVLKKPSGKDVEIEPPVATPEKQAKTSANSSAPVRVEMPLQDDQEIDDQEIGEEEQMENDPPLESVMPAKTDKPDRSSPVLKKPSAAKLPEEPKVVLKKPGAAEPKASVRKRGKSQLVTCEKHGGWTFYVFKRSTDGTPFNKYVAPDGKIFWTNQGAIDAGFKRDH